MKVNLITTETLVVKEKTMGECEASSLGFIATLLSGKRVNISTTAVIYVEYNEE